MQEIQRKLLRSLLLAGALLLTFGVPFAAGQTIVIDPPPERRPPLPASLELSDLRVDAVIDGPVATVYLHQTFTNRSGQTVEGVYLFPLPRDAAIGDFQMTVDGQVLEGQLYQKDEARRIYEEIVRRRQDPALLEYVDHNLFQARVFPIAPGESRELDLTYSQVLDREDGLYRFLFPLKLPLLSRTESKSYEIAVELRNQPGLRTIYSPTFPVTVKRAGGDGAIVRHADNTPPSQDFALYFGTDEGEIGLNLLSYKPAGEDGFFVLLATPAIDAEQSSAIERDLILVVDVSGSMQGEKIEQARQAAHGIVDKLNPGDRFNLITFSTGARLWQSSPVEMDAERLADAHRWIDRIRAEGSTDINRALLEALAQVGPGSDHAAYLLFLTDGLPTQGVTEVSQIVHNARLNTPQDRLIRLFTFGIGYDVNTDLLDTLSRDLGGRSSYVLPDERIDEAIGQFYAGISTPVLVDVDFDLGPDVVVDDVYPYPLPDLFAGEQLVVTGRYRLPTAHDGLVEPMLSGRINGDMQRYDYPERQLALAGGEPTVARLWATRKIGEMVDQIRIAGPQKEIVDAIVELSLRYGIVTPYTSYLVLEPEMVVAPLGAEGQPPTAPAPLALRTLAMDAVQEEADEAAAAPAMGEASVRQSKARSDLQTATSVAGHEAVRFVGGRTFARQGEIADEFGQLQPVWVDTLYDEDMVIENVRFGSDRYFELARESQIARWLAVSPELLLVLEPDHAVRVSLTATEADSTAPPLPVTRDDSGHSDDLWQQLRDWIEELLR